MSDTGSLGVPSRCTFVTGSSGPARLRWLEAHVATIRAAQPNARGAVLLADATFHVARQFAARVPGIDVQWLAMPCQCCPWLADLPRVARKFADVNRAEWIVIDVPPLAAAGLLAEFDRVLGWPRDVVVWLNREWSRARTADTLSPFQANLLALASRVVEEPPGEPPAEPSGPAPTLSLFQP